MMTGPSEEWETFNFAASYHSPDSNHQSLISARHCLCSESTTSSRRESASVLVDTTSTSAWTGTETQICQCAINTTDFSQFKIADGCMINYLGARPCIHRDV